MRKVLNTKPDFHSDSIGVSPSFKAYLLGNDAVPQNKA